MALPIIEQASKEGKFRSLDDIFSRENVKIQIVIDEEVDQDIFAEEYSKPIDVHRLTNIPRLIEQLGHLCDIKGIISHRYVLAFYSYYGVFRNCIQFVCLQIERGKYFKLVG